MNGQPTGTKLRDGFTGLPGGMDASTPADSATMESRTALAVNCVHRGGYISNRPGFRKCQLEFADETTQQRFDSGVYQGASVYYPDEAYPRIIASIGGRMFQIDIEPYGHVRELDVPNGPDNSFLQRVWFTQAEKWLIKQNGIDLPVIYDGSTCRRPNTQEIKIGTCGVYAWGRIWYALPDGRKYRATDIVYGSGNRDDVLKETECEYLQGADFVVPASCGKITAIVVPGMLDNATGQGPVHVLTETAVFSCNAPLDRDVWLDLTNPIQTISQNQHGALSDWSCVVVNGDIFMRAIDGIRSYAIARRNFGTWANTPISREIEPFIRNDNRALLRNCSGGLWDNRLLMTCAPSVLTGKGVVHAGIVVMDFDPVATFREVDVPIWDGLWTGLRIHQILVLSHLGEQRCFLFVRSKTDALELWELDRNASVDGEGTPIEWLFVPKQMTFGTPLTMKRLGPASLWMDELSGEVTFEVAYKVDDSPTVFSWANWQECAPTETCADEGEFGCIQLSNRMPQYRSKVDLPEPSENCVSINGRQSNVGYRFQPVVSVRGKCRIKAFLATAWIEPEVSEPSCGSKPCVALDGCPINPFEYNAES